MITLYTKTVCPYCTRAKAYLDRHGLVYETVNLEQDAAALDFIKNQKGHKTVPQLYVDGQLLVEGGATELEKLSADEINRRVALLSA